jgi:hypothetical protein
VLNQIFDCVCEMHVKTYYQHDIRRFKEDSPNFQKLKDSLSRLYKIPAQIQLQLSYLDNENDWVTIAEDRDLSYAFSNTHPDDTLHIKLTTQDTPDSMQSLRFQ